MAEAIKRIKGGNVPRILNSPPGGSLGMRKELAKLINETISKKTKSNEKSDSMNDKTNKFNNNEIVMKAEGIEITYNKMDKLLNEKIGPSDEKETNNNKNNDNDREQNT